MNQDKLEVIKQEMARVNIDTLGISELKWTRMGEFNSDDHYIYYCVTERLHFHFSLSCIGEGNGNPLQCSCLENPRDGEAWWAAGKHNYFE